MELEGQYRENLEFRSAVQYLQANQFGMLVHGDMDKGSFIFVHADQSLCFYDALTDKTEGLDPTTVIEMADPTIWDAGWAYLPGSEISLTVGGISFWDEIRNSPRVAAIASI